jgi:hypothetical protein
MDSQQKYFDPNAAQQKQRKLIKIIISLLIAAVLLLTVLALVGSNTSPGQKLGIVRASHEEVIRVLDDFKKQPASIETQNLIVNARVVLASENKQLDSIGVKPTSAQVEAAKTYPNIDTELEESVQNNQFDAIITDFITQMLVSNKQILESVEQETTNETTRTVTTSILTDYSQLLY